jgi:hypothetical protein
MAAFEEQPVVGLFGTCGDSTFRQDLFIPAYDELGIPYFNPQVEDWKPELAEVESDHVAYDVVQCWPVLGSTYGSGSLAEQGYSIAQSLRSASPLPKFVIPLIEMELDEALTETAARTESERARELAAKHLAKNASPNVFMVSSLEEMLETSIILYGAAKAIVELTRTNNLAYRQFMEGRRQQEAFAQALASGQLGADAANLVSKK